MQGYPQQQPYGDYSTTGYQQQQQQQQQYAYGTNTVSGDYGSYYAPTATGDLNSNTTSNAYGGGAYNSQYVQQPQQQQLQQEQQDNSDHNNNNVYSSSQWQQSYNYQDQNYATNDVGNGGMNTMEMAGPSAAQSTSFGTVDNTATMRDVGGDQTMTAPNATDENGLRWTWSMYPNTYRDSKSETVSAVYIPMPEMIIPLACMYTPLQPIDVSHLVIGDPAARGQQCPNCGAFWNKHCYREEGKFWVCLSCLRRNPTPPSYNPEHPALHYDTVEYIPPITSPANPPLLGTGTAEEAAAAARGTAPTRPTFIFIIDTCLPLEELEALKSNIVRCLDWLPSQSLIGLISFGARVSVWDLGTSPLPRCYNIRGDRAYEQAELARMLQLTDAFPVRGRFLSTLEECEFTFTTLVEELQCDDTVTPGNKRPLRTTGTAVSVGVRLLEALHHGPITTTINNNNNNKDSSSSHFAKGGRLLLFTGGPCTRGPGTVVSTEKEKMMRFHRDIIDGDIPFYESAFKMYNELEKRLSDVHACLDVFAESFDQVGILEMRKAVNQTGGTFICGDAFNHHMFSTSLQRYFDRFDLRSRALETEGGGASGDGSNFIVRSAFGVAFEVHTSADTLVSGVLGPCVVDEKANNTKPHRASSPIQVGVGGTTRWRVSTIDQGVTYTFVFDTATLSSKKGGGDNTSGTIANASLTGNSLGNDSNINNNNNSMNSSNINNIHYSNGTSAGGGESKRRFVQFVTRFRTPHGESRVRVTSVVLPISPTPPRMNNNNNSMNNINTTANAAWSAGSGVFDQTCAATVLARIAVSLLERHPSRWDAATRWLDTLLVRFVRRHAVFTPGVPESLRLHPSLALFPSFLFNLRRSEYFMMLNISPDETVFKRHWLMREQVENCVRMIQPTLHSYDIETPMATPVPLDSCSLRTDNILLMDAFFNIHIMWGTTIYAWIQAKYQEDPEYAYFAQLLNAVEDDASALLAARYPYPRFSRTDANGSEARHIKTRMNPTTTHHSGSIGAAAADGLGNANSNMMASAAGDHSDVIYTDEASIVKFMESLKKAVVSVDAKSDGSNNNSNGSW
ncbi:Sec23/Sec24 [Trypanosoma melophagium]|uniref:Sec23/Sec24 n=1 Tax=Trypanosoma melophagium TaxID=715481 RepID=UPI003519F916|nr:Sec23/Sec24 [Trypanosoma melophagium]